MNKVLLCVMSVVLFLISCNACARDIHVSVPNDNNYSEYVDISARSENKNFTLKLSNRTVSIKYDCSVKEGVIMLGAGTNGDIAFDSRGTGVILRSREEGSYIVTAAHVVTIDSEVYSSGLDCAVFVQRDEDAQTKLNRMSATIISLDKGQDLAILRINEDLKVSSDLSAGNFVGEDIWSSGYAALSADRRAVKMSITKGTLATLYLKKGSRLVHRVTCQIFQGNSGGPIWDREGRLVGIVLFLYGANTPYGLIPKEGEYYIRPADEIIKLALRQGVFEEVFKD